MCYQAKVDVESRRFGERKSSSAADQHCFSRLQFTDATSETNTPSQSKHEYLYKSKAMVCIPTKIINMVEEKSDHLTRDEVRDTFCALCNGRDDAISFALVEDWNWQPLIMRERRIWFSWLLEPSLTRLDKRRRRSNTRTVPRYGRTLLLKD